MKRKYNLRKIISKRSYTTEEIAELLSVHSQTVRTWRKEGLPPIEANTSPFLFLGSDIKSFLAVELAKGKVKLQQDECYCLRCRKATKPTNAQILDRHIKIGNNKDSAFLTGNCPECNLALRRFTTLNNAAISPVIASQKKPKQVDSRQTDMFNSDGMP